MKTRTKIAFASVLVGLVAVATGLSTLAWFNGSSSLMISNFNITLADRSDKNLLISTDNEHFYQTLYMRDEKTVENEENKNVGQYLPDVSPFRAVSTMFQGEWYNPNASDDEKALLPVFRRNVTNPGNLQKELYTSVNDYPEASAGFLRQELYFKSEAGGDVTIDAEKTKVVPDSDKNLEKARKIVDVGLYPELYSNIEDYYQKVEIIKSHLDEVTKSMRFSILVLNDMGGGENAFKDYAYTIIDPNKEDGEITYYGGVLDNYMDGYYDSFNGKEVLYGEVSGSPSYLSNSGSNEPNLTYSAFDANHKAGVEQVDVDSLKRNGQIAIEDSKTLSEAEDAVRIGLGQSSSSKKIVLSFYLEGWDKDNTNLSMYAHFKVDLAFKFASALDE